MGEAREAVVVVVEEQKKPSRRHQKMKDMKNHNFIIRSFECYDFFFTNYFLNKSPEPRPNLFIDNKKNIRKKKSLCRGDRDRLINSFVEFNTRPPAMSLKGVVALVTGGASGLGLSAAARIVRKGGRALIADLPSSDGVNVAKAISAQTGVSDASACVFCATDVTSESDVVASLDAVENTYGESVNAVINCAGIGPPRRTISKRGPHSLDEFKRILEINTCGTFNVIRLAADRMAQLDQDGRPQAEGVAHQLQGEMDDGPESNIVHRGVIINTASVAAFDGQIGQAAYSASKGAIVGMTLPIARDLSSVGIRVNTIAPGLFRTPLVSFFRVFFGLIVRFFF